MNEAPQISREELERIPLSPELHSVRQELLFKTESAWVEFEAKTESLMAEWRAFLAAVEEFQQENSTIQ